MLLGATMLLAGLGLLVVGLRSYLERSVPVSLALDGTTAISPAHYTAPWAMAVVLVAAAVYLLRGARDRVF
jgi:hypothetical protein